MTKPPNEEWREPYFENSASDSRSPFSFTEGTVLQRQRCRGTSENKKSATSIRKPQARIYLFCCCVNAVQIFINLENKDAECCEPSACDPETKLFSGEAQARWVWTPCLTPALWKRCFEWLSRMSTPLFPLFPKRGASGPRNDLGSDRRAAGGPGMPPGPRGGHRGRHGVAGGPPSVRAVMARAHRCHLLGGGPVRQAVLF